MTNRHKQRPLRFHGESYGSEVQFFERSELFYSRGAFIRRETAVRWNATTFSAGLRVRLQLQHGRGPITSSRMV